MSHPGLMSHNQPALERCIRDVVVKYNYCELRRGATVEAISEDSEFVYVTCRDRVGQKNELRAKFLVGADGKTGFTRKKYLEPRGVVLESQSKYQPLSTPAEALTDAK